MKKRFLIGFLVLFAIMAMCVGLVGCRGDSQEHTLTRHEAKEATCTEEGNIEYWECSHCDKLFADAEGKIPVTSVVVPKKAHTILIMRPFLPVAKRTVRLHIGNAPFATGNLQIKQERKSLQVSLILRRTY